MNKYDEAISLLQQLISTPSFSKEEERTATIIAAFLQEKNISTQRIGHNIIAFNEHFDNSKPTLLLNSHHDTVKPNPKYSKDPFTAAIEEEKLYGLGSNDAGGCLVALLTTFVHFYPEKDLPYNIILAATAEEEISGKGGVELILPQLPPITAAIVGEPTLLQLAIAERGLLVLNGTAHGKAGHAARNEGENALYKALQDISWFQQYQFEKVSPFLGPVKMNVTVIETENKAHNMVPATCNFVVDVRVNECYTFEEILAIIRQHIHSDITPRSTRLRSTSISTNHLLVQAGTMLGKNTYGSPTTSDKALMPFPALKMGPGDSARSHTADEFIYVQEIKDGIDTYIQLINQFFTNVKA